jgi:XTP/dITP diphosphohydrolase
MVQNLLIATRNAQKKREIQSILSNWDVNLFTLDDVVGMPEIEEDGVNFAENAVKKAQTIARLSGYITLADDSGLEVDALGGAPGVFSARFAGPQADDEANNRKLLELMKDIPATLRTARFVCVIAVATPDGRVDTVIGICEGKVATSPEGHGGFGYDPLFIPAGSKQSFAEMGEAAKNLISHRGKALLQTQTLLDAILAVEGQA